LGDSTFRGVALSKLTKTRKDMFEYVKINEKNRAVKFGFNALRHFSRMTGMKIQDMDKIGVDMTFDTALTLIYCGLMDGSRAAKEEFDYTIEDLADDLDNDMGAIERCMVVFTEMMTPATQEKKSRKEKRAEERKKKKK
tara:strand:- start:24 stop:440 length:417 start_codon:yes stop_codon:yes gene_type:complete